MADKKLSTKVFQRNFTTQPLGFCCQEVDNFLDNLNYDISQLERTVEQLTMQNKKLSEEIKEKDHTIKDLNRKLGKSKALDNIATTSSPNFSNIDILNRLTNLENMVQKILDNLENK